MSYYLYFVYVNILYMKNLLLNKIRLTYYLWALFVLFFIIFIFLPTIQFSAAVLTLFSINSFLYGFYISPILSGQKSRIDDLHKTIRSEANSLYALQLKMKILPTELRNQMQSMVTKYVKAKIKSSKKNLAEKEYENLISYCLNYEGDDKESIAKILDLLIANQQNRTQFMMAMSNKVYSNEWMVMLILFSITLGIIMMMNVDGSFILHIIKALLCTGLSMLMIILVKLNTLTHKKAKEIWTPFHNLIETRFYRID